MKFFKVVVFDLDACVWNPEMYQIWGGGSPFRYDGKNCIDYKGTKVELIGYVRQFLSDVKKGKFENVKLAIASKCDEPSWARECLSLFQIDGTPMINLFSSVQIYKGSKQNHLQQIQKDLNFDFKDMVFFDDQMDNINQVQKLGVLSIHTPQGFQIENWNNALKQYQNKF